ncbi:succinate dehydrogenase, hydrophobic membrane anchor protein [Roseovarius sp. SYSU LYC5161]|jgi:succinate dehydrogenase / fumarate reductase membrane anchor subunit|uniref:succinate dehydrogenase, hydrophobic membrane anchor protein n=1 Tax=Roseovarius halophilus (ex Wu et al. 2025) TaxID=3376060 RepID=UPI002871E8F3|nr:succinate dehydrogenase, hydrophobic membrane anchor protein [Roseovarius sp.]
MRYLTDRKRAVGLGSAKSGVHHFWAMKISSVGLLILVPLFIFTFGPILGEPHAEVVAYFARPFPAIVAALTIIVGFKHFRDGAQVLLEDYVHGTAQKVSILLMTCLSYGAMAVGVFAIAKLAL